MIVCIDVGNSNITYGVYKDNSLLFSFRNDTKEITCDDILMEYFTIGINQYGVRERDIECAVIDSVVPEIDGLLKKVLDDLNIEYYFVEYNSPLGINIDLDDPSEIGSDLLVGAFQAAEKYHLPLIVVDMGTATTLVYVDEKKNFKGGVIYPGLISSFNNLFKDASKLNRITMGMPENVVGSNTTDCIRSGMVNGSACAVNGLIEMIKNEYNLSQVTIVITGGIASFMHTYINNSIYDENLLLDGLFNVYNRIIKNKGW